MTVIGIDPPLNTFTYARFLPRPDYQKRTTPREPWRAAYRTVTQPFGEFCQGFVLHPLTRDPPLAKWTHGFYPNPRHGALWQGAVIIDCGGWPPPFRLFGQTLDVRGFVLNPDALTATPFLAHTLPRDNELRVIIPLAAPVPRSHLTVPRRRALEDFIARSFFAKYAWVRSPGWGTLTYPPYLVDRPHDEAERLQAKSNYECVFRAGGASHTLEGLVALAKAKPIKTPGALTERQVKAVRASIMAQRNGGCKLNFVNLSPLELVLSKLDADIQPDGQYKACCPAHADNNPSLSIKESDDGAVLIHCHAGCTNDAVVAALGLQMRDLMPPRTQPDRRVKKKSGRGRIVAAYPYVDKNGAVLYEAIRYDPKAFSQRKPDGKGSYGYNLSGVRRVLYRLPNVLKAARTGGGILICEGEKDVAALEKLGFTATTNVAGAGKWRREYSESLHGAKVAILPDNDDAGRNHAQIVAAALHGVATSVHIVELPGLPDKGDVSDWIRAGGDADALRELVQAAPVWTPPATPESEKDLVLRMESDGDGEGRGPSVATRLVQIAEERFTLWHTADGAAYASIPAHTGHTETWAIESTGFKDHLTRAYYTESGKAIAPNAMQSATQTLGAFARLDGPERPIYTRKADLSQTEGVIYLDLCNDKWQAVKITAGGWGVVNDPPVSFRRTKGMLALPAPVEGGSINELRQFVNAPDENGRADNFVLIVAWLLACLGPHRPYPIMHILGEQGTAKSSAARFLRSLIDPAKPDLRREPKEDRDLAIAATNAYLVAFDNVSGIPLWLSDTLCTLATGGGFGTRKLHSDDSEQLFDFLCPVLMTGIGEASTRGDFLQRSLLVSLPVIPDDERKDEGDVKPAFEAARPQLLGALLDAVTSGLKNYGQTRLEEKPRMADFARWVSACEAACPWEAGAFMDAYTMNQATGGDTALDADKIAPLIIELVEKGTDEQRTADRHEWTGTATALLTVLAERLSDKDKTGLPKNARALSVAIKRIAPALRTQRNIEIENKRGDDGSRFLVIRKAEKPDAKPDAKSKNTDADVQTGNFASGRKPPFDEGNQKSLTQLTQMTQKKPVPISFQSKSKKEEKGGGDGVVQNAKYNSGNFASFASLRQAGIMPTTGASSLGGFLRFVQANFVGKGLDIRAVAGYVVRVQNGRIVGVWNGRKGGPLGQGIENFMPFDAPLPSEEECDEALI